MKILTLMANDNCDYDSDGNGSGDRNWALDWQNSHILNVHWWQSGAAHSQHLNGNRKGYAAWWLWVSLAGWKTEAGLSQTIRLLQLLAGRSPDLDGAGPDLNGDGRLGLAEAITRLRGAAQ